MDNIDIDQTLRGIKQCLIKHNVPEYLHPGLLLWVEHGLVPGSYMSNVLNNNLVGASRAASGGSLAAIGPLGLVLFESVPVDAYGEKGKMADWMKRSGLRRGRL